MSIRISRRGLLGASIAASFGPALIARRTMAQPLQKVEVLLDWKPLPTYAGFFIARELGAFERQGLDVTFKEVQGDRKSTRLNSSHSQQSRMPSSA